MRANQQASAAVIERFEGYIAQYLGDGVLVYFGYPMAHEEDAVRAVRGGLEIERHGTNWHVHHPSRCGLGFTPVSSW